MIRLAALSLTLILLLSTLVAHVVFSQRRTFPQNRQIVFEMGRQNYDVYAIQPNSSFGESWRTLFDPQRSFDDRYVTGVDCSPDSRSLVFWYIFLYRFDLANDNLTQLALGAGLSQRSVWSPDGTRIAYIDDLTDRQPREIFTIGADGANKTRITDNDYQETSLSWSPDGANIAFTYSRLGAPQLQGLATADTASGSMTVLYEGAARLDNAAWSPDGGRIAFDMSNGERRDIYTIRTDGTALTRLTREATHNIIPHWSPDGALISYSAREPGGHFELFVMNADGSHPYLVFLASPNQDVFNRCWLET